MGGVLVFSADQAEWGALETVRSLKVIPASGDTHCARPNEVTVYALRHSSIARDLLANVPVRIVATKHDTSILMIERNYSKYISDHADTLSRRATARLRPTPFTTLNFDPSCF